MRFKQMKILALAMFLVIAFSLVGCSSKPETGIKVGVFGPLTGANSMMGIRQREGAQYAADEINAAGGVLGHKLELIFEDDEGVPANTANVMNKFHHSDNVLATVGSPNSPCVIAVLDLIEDAQTPHVVPSGVAMDITAAGNPWVFRVTATDEIYAKVIVDFAVDTLGLSRLAVLHTSNDYGQGGADLVDQYVKDKGLALVAVEGFDPSTTDFTPQLLKVKAADADGLITWVNYTHAAQIVLQARDNNLDVEILHCTGSTLGNYLELAGDAAEGVYGVTGGFHVDKDDPQVQDFVTAFTAEVGHEPDRNNVTAYDAISVLVEAIERAGSLDKDAIREAFLEIQDFKGINGLLSFRENGDGGSEAQMFQYQDGTMVLVQ